MYAVKISIFGSTLNTIWTHKNYPNKYKDLKIDKFLYYYYSKSFKKNLI